MQHYGGRTRTDVWGRKKMDNKENGGREAECDRNEDVSLEVSGATKMDMNTKCVYLREPRRRDEIHGDTW